MVIDTNSDFIESVENMGPQIKGVVKLVDYLTESVIIEADSGEEYALPFAWHDIDLQEHTKVTFKKYPGGEGYACDVALDTSGEAQALVPKTENTIAEILADSPECSLEDETFRIDSLGWKEIVLEDTTGVLINAKVNSERDVWELYNGEQLFTSVSMDRETKKAGREQDIMTGEQAQWLLKNTPNNVPEGCRFIGFLNSMDGKIHFSGENACYWIGETNEKGNQKALFCVDISRVDEEMRPYTDEMVISDYDVNSAMQVRLLKKKHKTILQLDKESEGYLKGYIEKFNSIKEAQKTQ